MDWEKRLARLERQNRLYGVLLTCLGLVVGAFVIMGQTAAPPPSQTLRARAVEVTDADGNVVVRLAATEGGQGFVETLNPQGDQLISLAATTVDGKGLISVSDEQGRKLLWLGATVDGEGLIASFDHYGAVKARWP